MTLHVGLVEVPLDLDVIVKHLPTLRAAQLVAHGNKKEDYI